MAHYILLITLSPEGQAQTLRDPQHILKAQNAISVPGVQVLGLYGVLGPYDFVTLLEAPDNGVAARFSIQLGVKAGAHITTLPAIPIGQLEEAARQELSEVQTGRELVPPRG